MMTPHDALGMMAIDLARKLEIENAELKLKVARLIRATEPVNSIPIHIRKRDDFLSNFNI